MNYFNKLFTFIKYRKIIDTNYTYFKTTYNLKRDYIYRLYTTISIPISKQEEFKNREYLKLKEYNFDDIKDVSINNKIDKYLNFEIDNYLNEIVNVNIVNISQDFNNIDLLKHVSSPKLIRVDKVNIDIIFEYNKMNMKNFFNFNRFILLFSILTIIPMYIFSLKLVFIPVVIIIFFLILNKIIVNRYIV